MDVCTRMFGVGCLMKPCVCVNSFADAVSLFKREIGGEQIGSEGGVAAIVADDTKKYFVFFKRDWFNSYYRQFPTEQGMGYGQSVSLDILEKAADQGAIIAIVFPDGKIYGLPAFFWLQYAESHSTTRQPHGDSDVTASVPSRLLQRLNSD